MDLLLNSKEIQKLTPEEREAYGVALLNLGTKIRSTTRRGSYFLNGSSSKWTSSFIRDCLADTGMSTKQLYIPANAIRYYIEVEINNLRKKKKSVLGGDQTKLLVVLCNQVYKHSKRGKDFTYYDDYVW